MEVEESTVLGELPCTAQQTYKAYGVL
jgi:hypothetical protein